MGGGGGQGASAAYGFIGWTAIPCWWALLGSPLGRDSCPWLPGWYGCAHEYFPGCGLVYRCQLPLRFAIFVLLNSHLECFFSASKIAIFFSVRYATNRLPHARVTKQKTVNLNLTALIFTHVKLTISYLIHIENHRLSQSRSLARASRSQSRYALKSSTCEQVYENHCALIYRQWASTCIFGQARSAYNGINAGMTPGCFEASR